MPTYEYRCQECGHQFEVFARMSDPAPDACEACGHGTLERVLFPVAVHYKGSGFYSTDYSGRSAGGSGSAGSGSAGTDAPKPDASGGSTSTSASSGSASSSDS